MTAQASCRRSAVPGLLVVAVLLAVLPLVAAGPQRESRERTVLASVLDKAGAPVSALTAKDFVVREDSVAREILRVEPAGPPDHIVLLVDDSQATADLTIDLRAGVKAFAEGIARGQGAAAIRLTTFGDRPTRRVEFTPSAALIATGIDQVFPRPGAGATLLEAIMESVRDLRTRSATRPVIVAFVAEEGPEFSPQRHTQVAEALKGGQVSLWSLVLQSRQGQDMSEAGRERSMVLSDVSRQSGGYSKVVLAKQGIVPGFESLAAALSARYAVAYGRPESLIPPTRLTVEVRNSALQVIATSWAAE